MVEREKWLEKFVEGYMFHDIDVCIKGYANFAAALALSVYTDVLGGLINGNLTVSNVSGKNFITFLKRMGYGEQECDKYYKEIRCGLAHQYFIKGESTVAISTLENTRGIHERYGVTYFFAEVYFSEFKNAYFAYKKELASSLSLQANFEKAIQGQTIPHQVKRYFDPSLPPVSYISEAISPVSGSVVIFVPIVGPLSRQSNTEGEVKYA